MANRATRALRSRTKDRGASFLCKLENNLIIKDFKSSTEVSLYFFETLTAIICSHEVVL